MRIAVLSDIHGNITAFRAVVADIQKAAPDLIIHAGDLADAGSSPVEVIDEIRALGWTGVMGNTDQMLVEPYSLETFASTSKAPASLWAKVGEMADYTRQQIGPERVAWLGELPMTITEAGVTVLHASPTDCWRAPTPGTPDEELHDIFSASQVPTVVFGHIHRSFIRQLEGHPRAVVNSGSVGLPYDGDPRASYVLIDETIASIRRVEYDIEKEVQTLISTGLPGAEWTARMLRTGSPQMP